MAIKPLVFAAAPLTLSEAALSASLCCEVDLTDWHENRPITGCLCGYPCPQYPIRSEAHLARALSSAPGCGSCAGVLSLPGSRRRVTRNTARHGRRSVCQHRLGSGWVQGTQHESSLRSQFHHVTPLGTPLKPHQNLWHFLGVRRGRSKDIFYTISEMLRKSLSCLGPNLE